MLMVGLVVVHDSQILLPPSLNIIRPGSVHWLQVSSLFELYALCGVCDCTQAFVDKPFLR